MKRLAMLILVFMCATQAVAIVNGTAPTESDTTYDAVGAFAVTWRLGLAVNPNDPASALHNWYCSAVLVDNCTIITARHCVAAYGESQPHAVRFRRKPDGTIGSIESGVHSFFHATIASFHFPTSGDVAIGYLSECVTHIQPIRVDFSLPNPYGKLDVAGWGKEGPGQNEGMVRRLLSCSTWATASSYNYVLFADAWQAAGPGCGPNNNDSGGPMISGACVVGITSSYGIGMPLSYYYGTDPQITALGTVGCGATDPARRN